MKVILLQDVAKIGKRFSVTEVPDGYALNQLIPKKLAEPATPVNLKRIEKHHAVTAATKEAGDVRHEKAIVALAERAVVVTAEANEQDHLFKAVHEADIVAAAVAAGVDIDATMIKIPAPIKSLGNHEIHLVGGKKDHIFAITVNKK